MGFGGQVVGHRGPSAWHLWFVEGVRVSKAEMLQVVEGCVHHWVLEPPRGELTSGRCKKCGKERDFTGETSYRIGRGSSHRH